MGEFQDEHPNPSRRPRHDRHTFDGFTLEIEMTVIELAEHCGATTGWLGGCSAHEHNQTFTFTRRELQAFYEAANHQRRVEMSEEFKREERYIVTKIKTGKRVECVVIESDWPEYEPVWAMLQARMEGRLNENAELKQKLEHNQILLNTYCENLEVHKATIESLNLRVARLVDAGRKYADLVECYARQYNVLELASPTRAFDKALSSEPDSQWLREKKAEALEEVQMMFIKWYVSEREARFVFASTEKRDEFVRLMIGASELRNPPAKES